MSLFGSNPVERLTNIMGIVTAGNLASGRSLRLKIQPGKIAESVEITGEGLVEGLGYKNVEAKCRALESALREKLNLEIPEYFRKITGLPESRWAQLALDEQQRRMIVLPDLAVKKLGKLSESQAEEIGIAISKDPKVLEAFRDKTTHAVAR